MRCPCTGHASGCTSPDMRHSSQRFMKGMLLDLSPEGLLPADSLLLPLQATSSLLAPAPFFVPWRQPFSCFRVWPASRRAPVSCQPSALKSASPWGPSWSLGQSFAGRMRSPTPQ